MNHRHLEPPHHRHHHHHNNHPTTGTSTTISKAKTEEYRLAFANVDTDGDGYITMDEMETAMNRCGQHPTKRIMQLIMTQADTNHDGMISIDEFMQSMIEQHAKQQRRSISKHSNEELVAQFKMFDKNGDGYIERNEMVTIVRELQLEAHFSIEVIDTLFGEADVDGDGRISLPEFIAAMK